MNYLQKTSVLVVDGDSDARERIAAELSQDLYQVVTMADAESGLDHLGLLKPSLVVLHLPLHQAEGDKLVRRFRESSAALLIVLADNQDRRGQIENLRQGADYVVPASVSIRELRSRMRALVWRSRTPYPPAPQGWRTASQGVAHVSGDAN
ncbi:response regulator transcription factor [Chloroflexota bacterium]